MRSARGPFGTSICSTARVTGESRSGIGSWISTKSSRFHGWSWSRCSNRGTSHVPNCSPLSRASFPGVCSVLHESRSPHTRDENLVAVIVVEPVEFPHAALDSGCTPSQAHSAVRAVSRLEIRCAAPSASSVGRQGRETGAVTFTSNRFIDGSRCGVYCNHGIGPGVRT
jgi:hypothetical protein